jgi:hypothetical protein
VTAGAQPEGAQQGFLMAGLIALIAIMMIFSLLTYQAWDDIVRRDNEAEMMFRARDFVRAIQRYRVDHGGAGPMELKLLLEPGPRGQYYLRRMYKDPLVRNGKWGLLYLGPDGRILDPNAEMEEGLGGLTPPGTGTGLGGLANMGQGQGGLQGLGQGQQQVPGVQPGMQSGIEIKPIESIMDGEESVVGGKQLSGLPIAGVRSLCTEQPFRVYKGQTQYAQWLFTYFDLDPAQNQNPAGTTNPPGGTTNPPGGTTNPPGGTANPPGGSN